MASGLWASSAKLTCPLPGPGFLPLERVRAVLDGCRQVWLEAPGGFGKTDHVACWLEDVWGREATPYAWLSLDAGDADPIALAQDLAAAVTRAWPGLAVPLEPRPARRPAAAFALGRQIARALEPCGPFVLVVDDVHHLGGADAAWAVLEALVEAAPRALRLVLIGRDAPAALPLARWQGQGRMGRVGVDTLALDAADTLRLLAAELGEVPAEWAARLAEATGGWPLLVRLAAQHLAGRARAEWDLDALLGHGDGLYRYLAGEILGRHRPADQRALMALSLADQVDPGVAAALLPHAAEGAYARLVRPPWFGALGPGGVGARLHPLLRAFLRGEAERRLGPARVRALELRLASFLAGRRQLGAAIDHALAAGALEFALPLIDRAVPEQVRMGRGGEVRRWLEAFGSEAQAEAAPLLLARARLAALDDDHRQAFRLVESARARYQEAGDLEGVVACLELAVVALELEPTPEVLASARAARDGGPPAASAWARLWLARLHAARRSVGEAEVRRAVAAVEASRPVDPRTARARIVGDHLRYLAGAVGTILATPAQIVEGLRDQLFDYWPALLYAGRWEELETLLEQARAVPVEAWARDFVRIWLELPRAVLLALRGEAEEALAVVEAVERVVRPAPSEPPVSSLELSVLAAVKAGCLSRLGRLEEAERTARANQALLALSPTMAPVGHLDLAQVLLAQGRTAEAAAELEAAASLAAEVGLRGLYFRTLRLALDLSQEPPTADAQALVELLGEVERFGAYGFWPLYDPGPIRPALAALGDEALAPPLRVAASRVRRLYAEAERRDGAAPARPVAAVRLATLGGLAWRGPGQPLLLPSRRVAELLLRLLWVEGASLSREAVAEAMWPETAPQDQMNRLRVTLHELRRWLGAAQARGETAASVTADRTSVGLAAWQTLQWDVARMRHEMRAARRLHDAGQGAAASERMAAAIALYVGPFLPEAVWYEPFLYEREALEREHAAFVEWAAAVLGPRAIRLPELLAQAVRANPAQESLQRLWLESLALQGRLPEARRALQECAALLEAAVGVKPPDEWLRLVADQP